MNKGTAILLAVFLLLGVAVIQYNASTELPTAPVEVISPMPAIPDVVIFPNLNGNAEKTVFDTAYIWLGDQGYLRVNWTNSPTGFKIALDVLAFDTLGNLQVLLQSKR